jgi:hypothetical protein
LAPGVCVANTDPQGNFGGYFTNGTYQYTITHRNVVYGPYSFTIGGSGGSPGGSINPGLANQGAYYATDGNTISPFNFGGSGLYFDSSSQVLGYATSGAGPPPGTVLCSSGTLFVKYYDVADSYAEYMCERTGAFTYQWRKTPPLFSDNEIPVGVIDGVNTTFTLAHVPVGASLQLFYNGLLSFGGGVDYTLVGSTITTVNPPPTGASLHAWYRY